MSSSIKKWLNDGEKESLQLGYADQETIFATYWAATQMRETSACFSDIERESCHADLGKWLTRVRAGDPRFIAAYEQSYVRLGLPQLVRETD
ncbi:hypothetical protein [Caballeronia sp. LZ034LL]|uniref:hypothetical protein n=1 Tax=Caballeronia sp. LZ034LL TaxID=3038567 RepID=UPI0028645867|nr:hypothetical protein [Caballeronia sp. LZ034LL]MDR5833329.1 hypothetical protein [Caballeronia sp. LZ034LL]